MNEKKIYWEWNDFQIDKLDLKDHNCCALRFYHVQYCNFSDHYQIEYAQLSGFQLVHDI